MVNCRITFQESKIDGLPKSQALLPVFEIPPYLFSNQLKTLSKELGNLKALTYLNLKWNQLKTLPPELGNLKALTDLDLSGNQLKTLPKELGNLKALTQLVLSDNPLSEKEKKKIKKLLPKCRIYF